MNHLKSLRAWMHGLAAAGIGGAVTTLGVAFADPNSIQFNEQGIRHMMQVAAAGALITALAYLKQSPLPPSGNP